MSTPPSAPDAAPMLPPVPPNIAQIAAPVMFSILFNWVLYGILLVQVYKRLFKVLVFVLLFLNTLQTALTGVDAWYWFCNGYGNLIKLSNPYISAYDTPMLGSVIAIIVQWFFCYRIYSLSKSYLLAGFIAMISLMGCVGGIIGGIRGAILGNFAAARLRIDMIALYVILPQIGVFSTDINGCLQIWLIATAVADVLLAVSLTFLLFRSKASGRFHSTDLINRIVRLTVETTIVSASLAMITLILYFAIPDKSYFICPTGSFGKVYSIALLMTFNNRVAISKRTENNTFGVANSTTAAHSAYGQDTEMGRTLVSSDFELKTPSNLAGFKQGTFSSNAIPDPRR
ncbi:hypothetical protein BU17DRAFT_69605 [Hysterangium stoloniferum]|nr:hypothetical protein BU17DRAFT_69605 [Hysterangium stoloniferum]